MFENNKATVGCLISFPALIISFVLNDFLIDLWFALLSFSPLSVLSVSILLLRRIISNLSSDASPTFHAFSADFQLQ